MRAMVNKTIKIWRWLMITTKSDSWKNSNLPVIIGWIAFVLAPCATCTKFCKTIDIPKAEISGANLKEPLNGL